MSAPAAQVEKAAWSHRRRPRRQSVACVPWFFVRL